MTAHAYISGIIARRAGFPLAPVLEIIATLIPFILDCIQTPEEASAKLRHPGWLMRKRIQNRSWAAWQAHGRPGEFGTFLHAVFETLREEATPEFMRGIYKDASEQTGEWRAVS